MRHLLQITHGQATVSTLTIAEYADKNNKYLVRLINDNKSDFEEFGQLGFETQAIKNSKNKVNEVRYYNLNEQQYSLLMTYLRNNPKVKEFKKNMVKAFYAMRNKIEHDGKNYKCVINGYKSQVKQLQNKLLALPHKSEEEAFFIKAKSLCKLELKPNANFTEIVQYHLGMSLQYIKAMKTGGNELQQYCANEIEKYKSEKNQARDKQIKAEQERDKLKKTIDKYVLVSNEMLRLRYKE